MPDAVRAEALHQATISTPEHSPIAHVVARRIVDDTRDTATLALRERVGTQAHARLWIDTEERMLKAILTDERIVGNGAVYGSEGSLV